ncbi:hypothetical protein DEIGR_101748 [Deinococcus grandis]|uniref:DUF1579 domain-containing protein n=1 Tax=Deinococcus grandis TaxID=57498 RepID=A0A117DNH6_9DEIO|nr:hypothetical protein [Deinococcus grandis]BBN94782.1 hypothetical protein DEGR_15150 [Deinococcus grandis]GAQ21721.1 hypothetical protein DEIGR_101748 [Deinococcus grandis]
MSEHDFDFLHGNWVIQNRRLRDRLVGSQDWEEFQTVARVRPALGSLGNVEDINRPDGTPLGLTVRAFERAAQRWTIQWIGASDGAFQSPMTGTFTAGVGTFYGDDEWKGQPCRCRFTWQVLSPSEAHWEQALSTDGGVGWETNWTMDFRRSGSRA